jgi:hypothetical protein
LRRQNEFPVIDLDAHEADKAKRAAAREARRELMEDCCDHEVAARLELEKPRHEYTVHASWKSKRDGGKMQLFEHKRTVVGLNENDAWARFCDATGYQGGRRSCRSLVIEKGKEVSVAAFVASQQPAYQG